MSSISIAAHTESLAHVIKKEEKKTKEAEHALYSARMLLLKTGWFLKKHSGVLKSPDLDDLIKEIEELRDNP